MFWLGIQGRKKIADLERSLGVMEKRLHEVEQAFGALDLEMTDKVDRLNGIAKRMQGRRAGPLGGRPPAEKNGDAEAENGPTEHTFFSRHVE